MSNNIPTSLKYLKNGNVRCDVNLQLYNEIFNFKNRL